MKVSKSEIPLELDCWIDDLSPAQLAFSLAAEKEHNKIRDKLKNLMNTNDGQSIFSGDLFSAFTFKGDVLQEYNDYVLQRPSLKPEPPTAAAAKPGTRKSKRAATTTNLVYLESGSDSEDEFDDIPLAKRMAMSSSKLKNKKLDTNIKEEKDDNKKKSPKSKKEPQSGTTAPDSPVPSSSEKPLKSKKEKEKEPAVVFKPSEISSVGGLVIGADGKDGKNDGKEIKLQGKTFPSLVVLAKPWLKVKDMSSTRSKLDSKVKLVLMLTPNKFTEWLIQEGLLKAEQKCSLHKASDHKLGVYSDAAKFPYSGGYVWISDCCPTRFVSVFHGSLFEAAPHPPSCILKLIYHWACQTNIQNVVQWVKVDNVYVKGVYTWLRAVCTLAIQQKCKLLGGAGKYVEVGVISLGTTSQDGQQRQVKVEVLGVFDYTERTIRLKAIEPVSDADRNYKKRFQTILEPLNRWVHKDSIIAIDLTVDKMTLYQLGFKNIVQAAANDTTAKHTNTAVMDYLRRIVPRMFQNTLSLLSRQMIQQFLDELVWREHFGTYALQAFNNITSHIAEQTRLNTTETLTQRLYEVIFFINLYSKN